MIFNGLSQNEYHKNDGFMENPNLKWRMTGGKPYDFGNPHVDCVEKGMGQDLWNYTI